MRIPLELKIALRYTRSRRKKQFLSFISTAAITGIAASVMTLIIVMSVMNGFEKSLKTHILAGLADATITGMDGVIHDWPTVVSAAKKNVYVKAAAPYAEGQGFIQGAEHSGAGIIIRGIIPSLERGVTNFGSHMVEGELASLQTSKGILLGRTLAARLKVRTGDKVIMLVPHGAIDLSTPLPKPALFKVVGIFDMGMEDYDAHVALIPMEDATALLRTKNPTGIRLRLVGPDNVRSVAKSLSDKLGQDFRVETWMDSSANIFSAIAMEKVSMFIILTLIVLVAVVNLISMLMMLVTEKQAEIAILRTLGSTPTSITMIFVYQGALVGMVGIALGVVLGTMLAWQLPWLAAWLQTIFHMKFLPADVYSISEVPSRVSALDVLSTATVALTLSLLATLYPSFRAARIAPAQALSNEN